MILILLSAVLASAPAAEARSLETSTRTYFSAQAHVRFDVPKDASVFEREIFVDGPNGPGSLLVLRVVPAGVDEMTSLGGQTLAVVEVHRLAWATSVGEWVPALCPERGRAVVADGTWRRVGGLDAVEHGADASRELFVTRGARGYRIAGNDTDVVRRVADTLQFSDAAPEAAVLKPGATAAVATATPVVRMIYLVPKGRVVNAGYKAGMERAIRELQKFYRDELGNGKTFALHNPVVEVVATPHNVAWYTTPAADGRFWESVLADGASLLGSRFDDPLNRWVFYIDATQLCTQYIGGTSGIALLNENDLRGLTCDGNTAPCGGAPDLGGICRWVGGLGHELGHAFHLPHPDAGCPDPDAGCNNALMQYGYATFPNAYLLAEDKTLLLTDSRVKQFFTTFDPGPLSQQCGDGCPPARPAGLAAAASDRLVKLTWNVATGAQSYTVKRGLALAGPYAVIASGVTDTSYGDRSVTNGKTYSYLVTAVNAAGESPNSARVSALPNKGLAGCRNVALGRPVVFSTNGADETCAYCGDSASDATDGSVAYTDASLGIEDGVAGFNNADYAQLLEVTATIDLGKPYAITKVRYNMGDAQFADSWGADSITTPLGTTAVNPGSSYAGAWTEQTGSATTSSVAVVMSKTRTSASSDWMFVGEIEVCGEEAPSISVTDASVTEGNTGTLPAVFTVSLSAASTLPVSVQYQTADGTAVAPGDYGAKTLQTLSFAAGQTSRSFSVAVKGDARDEVNEKCYVQLSNAVNATILDAQGAGTIVDNDPLPSLRVTGGSMTEGDAGTTTLAFGVTLTPASGRNVTVRYATANGTALAGPDYASMTAVLTFTPGQTAQTVLVTVNGDLLDEPSETVFVNLSAAVAATIAVPQAAGTIKDNDPMPVISVADGVVTEGNAGATLIGFNVTLSTPSGQAVTVTYATAAAGTGATFAVAGVDYTAKSGTLTFAAGQTSKTVNVVVTGETAAEPDETFRFNLSAPVKTTLGDGQGIGTIQNDD